MDYCTIHITVTLASANKRLPRTQLQRNAKRKHTEILSTLQHIEVDTVQYSTLQYITARHSKLHYISATAHYST